MINIRNLLDSGLVIAVVSALFFLGESYAEQERLKKDVHDLEQNMKQIVDMKMRQVRMEEQLIGIRALLESKYKPSVPNYVVPAPSTPMR